MIDSMNAEIALGTVSNVQEGVTWLGYTYLFVRMKKNPMFYGWFSTLFIAAAAHTVPLQACRAIKL
jgi:replicative superfamily II helicase